MVDVGHIVVDKNEPADHIQIWTLTKESLGREIGSITKRIQIQYRSAFLRDVNFKKRFFKILTS